MRTACSPKSDNELVFETELWKYGGFCDTYIQSIVRREMKEIIDSVLSEHYENFASEVYVYGLATAYDSDIRSAEDASIKTFTEAIPETNSSTIWIAFDRDEFGNDYETVELILTEIVKDFELARVGIGCYFVNIETVLQCQEKILNNHLEYSYDIGLDMDVVLSKERPQYHYFYNGSDYGLRLCRIVDKSGVRTPNFKETFESD